MPSEEVSNPFYSRGGSMQLYNLLEALEMSMKKHGGWNGFLEARQSAEKKKAERKRKRQETLQAKREVKRAIVQSENKFFTEHTSFDLSQLKLVIWKT